VLNGVLCFLGEQWRELPESYPPYQTHHRRFQRRVRKAKLATMYAADIYRDYLSNKELIRRFRAAPTLFAPGTDSHYSNEGYFLLAMNTTEHKILF
jgi:transposase